MHTEDLRLFIDEARKVDPNIDYTDVPKKKSDPTNIDRVVANMKGNPSGILTRIAKQYSALKKAEEELTKLRQGMNPQIKGLASEYFDDADKIYTRVIKTLQFTITLSKQIEIPAGTKETFQVEEFFLELLDMLPELGDELEKLKQKFTTIMPTPAKTPPAKLSVKHVGAVKPPIAKKNLKQESFKYVKRDVSEAEGIAEFDDFDRRLADWDRRFAELEQKFFQSI